MKVESSSDSSSSDSSSTSESSSSESSSESSEDEKEKKKRKKKLKKKQKKKKAKKQMVSYNKLDVYRLLTLVQRIIKKRTFGAKKRGNCKIIIESWTLKVFHFWCWKLIIAWGPFLFKCSYSDRRFGRDWAEWRVWPFFWFGRCGGGVPSRAAYAISCTWRSRAETTRKSHQFNEEKRTLLDFQVLKPEI